MLGSPMNPREALLVLSDVQKVFGGRQSFFGPRKKAFHVLRGVDIEVGRREVVGLVGESGCGKSTLAQVAIRLLDVDDGTVAWKGADVTDLDGRRLKDFRRGVQMVFQDTGSSLNPRKTVLRHLLEALSMSSLLREQRRGRAVELLDMVGLDAALASRLAHQLSGGQRQRLAIARALAIDPELIIADEPVASLDVSLQAQIVNLLDRLRRELGLAMLFISHDLALVARISDRVAVMFAGTIVEEGAPSVVLHAPSHPYTRALLAAIPTGISAAKRPRAAYAEATELPDTGCRFALRCHLASDICRTTEPPRVSIQEQHYARCHHATPAAGESSGGPVPVFSTGRPAPEPGAPDIATTKVDTI